MTEHKKWFKAGARIARTGGRGWTRGKVLQWVLDQGGTINNCMSASQGFLAERKLVRQHGVLERHGKPLGR